jgi:hypothetical protein
MPVRVNCPFCQAGYTLPDPALGKQIQCNQCGKAFAVGNPAPPTRPTAPAAPTKVPPRAGRLRSATETRSAPTQRGGGDFGFGPQSGEPTARSEAPRSKWGSLCLVGCLVLACLFVVLLAGGSIAGWWLMARAEARVGPPESLMNPWTGPAKELPGP